MRQMSFPFCPRLTAGERGHGSTAGLLTPPARPLSEGCGAVAGVSVGAAVGLESGLDLGLQQPLVGEAGLQSLALGLDVVDVLRECLPGQSQ